MQSPITILVWPALNAKIQECPWTTTKMCASADRFSKRLLALAAQKFVADIAQDAYQYSKIRAAGSTTGGAALPAQPRGRYGKDRGRAVLTMDDLGTQLP